MQKFKLIDFIRSKTQSVTFVIFQILNALYSIRHDRFISDLPQCDVLLICHDGDRATTKNQLKYAQLIDSLCDQLEYNGLQISAVSIGVSNFPSKEIYRNPVQLNRYMFLYAMLRAIGANIFSNTVLSHAYKSCIRQSQCKVIVTQQAWRGLTDAANYLDIPLYLLVHGIGYPEPDIGHKGVDPFGMPDFYLSLDKITTQSLSTLAPSEQIIPTVHPWLKQFEVEQEAACLDWRVPKSILDSIDGYSKVVLFSLQNGYDGELDVLNGIIPNGIIHDEIVSAIEMTAEKVVWLLRLHPRQQMNKQYYRHREYVRELERKYPNVIVENVASTPLPALLKVVSSHLTMVSMTCYEAAWSHIPSLVLCPTVLPGGFYEAYFKDLVENGLAEKSVLDRTVISNWVSESSPKSGYFSSIRYYQDYAVEHILNNVKFRKINFDE